MNHVVISVSQCERAAQYCDRMASRNSIHRTKYERLAKTMRRLITHGQWTTGPGSEGDGRMWVAKSHKEYQEMLNA